MNKKQLQDYLDMEMSKVLCQLELNIYQGRQDRLTTKIQRYFNSTPLRNAFNRIITYSYIVNEFYTISCVADQLRTTRQSISNMVEECEAEGWIEVDRSPNRVGFKGTASCYVGFLNYLNHRKELAKDITKGRWNDLTRLADMVENDFTLYANLSDKPHDIDIDSQSDNVENNGVQSGIKQKTN